MLQNVEIATVNLENTNQPLSLTATFNVLRPEDIVAEVEWLVRDKIIKVIKERTIARAFLDEINKESYMSKAVLSHG